MAGRREAASQGFPAISAPDAHILVLGSLPGAKSIAEQQYYAHPQNAFWRIMRELYGIEGDYERRCRMLTGEGIALWDVLERSYRPGSMDADIDLATAKPNDFDAFFAGHPGIRRICFNGRKAEALFRRFLPAHDGADGLEYLGLPSTSPAYASMSFDEKLARWRQALEAKPGGVQASAPGSSTKTTDARGMAT